MRAHVLAACVFLATMTSGCFGIVEADTQCTEDPAQCCALMPDLPQCRAAGDSGADDAAFDSADALDTLGGESDAPAPDSAIDDVAVDAALDVADACVPTGSCGSRICGAVSNGCGGTLPCGNCPSGKACSDSQLACIAAVDLAPTQGSNNCAIMSDRSVRCWGALPDDLHVTPVTLPTLSGALSVVLGNAHACAILADHSVACWGNNDHGELGDGTKGGTKLVPTTVPGLSNVDAIAIAGANTCALLKVGSVQCWGAADLTGVSHLSPTPVSGLSSVTQIAGGLDDTLCALTGTTLYCFGHNGYSEAGTNGGAPQYTPVSLSGIYSSLSIDGGKGICALQSDKSVSCWGDNSGFGPAVLNQPTAMPQFGKAQKVAVGWDHVCALQSDGTVTCAGQNDKGQLGDGGFGDRVTAKTVPGLAGVSSLVSGVAHTCALSSSSGVVCWGSNFRGELGHTGADNPSPTPVVW